MVITKREDVTKQGSCKILWRKLHLRESLLLVLVLIQFLGGGVGVVAYPSLGWGGGLFEAGRLLTFSAFGMSAYSRWALIRGWALIWINTVVFGCHATFPQKNEGNVAWHPKKRLRGRLAKQACFAGRWTGRELGRVKNNSKGEVDEPK